MNLHWLSRLFFWLHERVEGFGYWILRLADDLWDIACIFYYG